MCAYLLVCQSVQATRYSSGIHMLSSSVLICAAVHIHRIISVTINSVNEVWFVCHKNNTAISVHVCVCVCV